MVRCEPYRRPHPAVCFLFTEHLGGRQRPECFPPAKKQRHGGTNRTAAGISSNPQAVEQHRTETLFRSGSGAEVIHTEGESRQRPHKPAMEFTYAEGWTLKPGRISKPAFNESCAWNMLRADTRTPGRGDTSRQAERQRARKTRAPPFCGGKIVQRRL